MPYAADTIRSAIRFVLVLPLLSMGGYAMTVLGMVPIRLFGDDAELGVPVGTERKTGVAVNTSGWGRS